jgi:hypothetical protein
LIDQIAQLKKQLENLNKIINPSCGPASDYSAEAQQEAEQQASDIQAQILKLTAEHAQEESEAVVNGLALEAACLAAAAAGLPLPTP